MYSVDTCLNSSLPLRVSLGVGVHSVDTCLLISLPLPVDQSSTGRLINRQWKTDQQAGVDVPSVKKQ